MCVFVVRHFRQISSLGKNNATQLNVKKKDIKQMLR